MKLIPQIIGLLAVATFLLSYQQKKRSNIIFLNVVSRCLYILQYLLLGAFAGAALDILGAVSSVVAGKKHTPFIKRHTKGVILLMNTGIIVIGGTIALINHSWIDVFSIIGVLLHTSAFWLSDEKIIRREAPSLGVESFCYFVQNTPGVYYDIGSGVGTALHTPTFCVDESCLAPAVALQCSSVLELLKEE